MCLFTTQSHERVAYRRDRRDRRVLRRRLRVASHHDEIATSFGLHDGVFDSYLLIIKTPNPYMPRHL